jgi:hypothetical protein
MISSNMSGGRTISKKVCYQPFYYSFLLIYVMLSNVVHLDKHRVIPDLRNFLKTLSSFTAPVVSLLPLNCADIITRELLTTPSEIRFPPLNDSDSRTLQRDAPFFFELYQFIIHFVSARARTSGCKPCWPVCCIVFSFIICH